MAKKYLALWDNDREGIEEKTKAEEIFNEIESQKFFLLPKRDTQRKRILQDLFDGNDLKMIKSELEIPNNTNFNKTIITLYFSEKRNLILRKISQSTKNNFKEVFKELKKANV